VAGGHPTRRGRRMRDPCPYCGLPRISYSRIDPWTRQILRDIKDHNCPEWERPPVLSSVPTDTSFIREAGNSPEGLALYRKALR
jgi:hypothetical protein